MTSFQQQILDWMKEGTWYVVSAHGGPATYPKLPGWFHSRQRSPMRTFRSMVKPPRMIAIKELYPGKWLVSKCYGLRKPRWV